MIYGIGGTLYIASAIVYFVFGTGNKQEFNEGPEEKELQINK